MPPDPPPRDIPNYFEDFVENDLGPQNYFVNFAVN